jgi:hypothetical protein
MPFYRDRVYPQLVSVLGNPEPFRQVRRRIVPLAQGTVLEIGVGPGVNFAHYDPARVMRTSLASRSRGRTAGGARPSRGDVAMNDAGRSAGG